MASPGQALAGHMAGFTQAPLQQKFGYLITLAAAVAVLTGAWMWSRTPDYRVLFANLGDRDGGAVITALNQMNVPYRFGEGGGSAIMVPGNVVHDVRLKLATQGLPKGNADAFAANDKSRFGTTVMQEEIGYQRALETELARSVQSLASVQSARVHLALARNTSFVREGAKSTASVVLQLYAGRALEPGQVNGIVHLVSSSVRDLPAKNVAVIDQNGSLLSSSQNSPGGLDPNQLRYVGDVESAFVKRIETIVSPLVGSDNVRATVTADMDFSEVQDVSESYKPNSKPEDATVRSQQTSESTQAGPGAGGGVPGAASNQPPQPAQAPVTAAPGATAPGTASTPAVPLSSRKDSTVNYEVGKNMRVVSQPKGSLKRLSVAVVVNHRKQTDQEGKVTFVPLPEDETKRITELVKEVMSFNKDRGDTVSVVNAPFLTPAAGPVEEVAFWQKPDFIATAKDIARQLLIAGVVLYVVLGVFRPLLRTFATPPPEPEVLPPQENPGDEPQIARPVSTYDMHLQTAKKLAKDDPKVVANVVKSWVSPDER
jgi:flagellar M-ring protein FliF